MVAAFDPNTGALPPGNHQATLEQIAKRLGFAPPSLVTKGAPHRRRSLLGGRYRRDLHRRQLLYEKPDPGDVDGYWVEPDEGVYDRIEPYWIGFELVLVPHPRKWKWRMWADHGVEFFIHPAMQASPEFGFPEFFRQDRGGRPRGVIQVVKAVRS